MQCLVSKHVLFFASSVAPAPSRSIPLLPTMANSTSSNGSPSPERAYPQEYKITLYSNRACPYAHRVHITLAELGVQYEEVNIDLDKPRDAWYLKINPV